jgi:protein-tyrosine sulfotransferase
MLDLALRIRKWADLVGPPCTLESRDDRPFFVTSAGRSGTTLLRRILSASPELHIPPENWCLKGMYERYRRHRADMSWRELVGLVLSTFEYSASFPRWFDHSLRDLAEELFDVPEQEQCMAVIVDALYRLHAREHGRDRARWGDKSGSNAHAHAAIEALFPQAQYINLLRDGVDVVLSCLNAELITSVDQAAHWWQNAVRRNDLLTRRYPDRVICVRYEDLVADPHQQAQRVCQFLGIAFQEDMLDASAADTIGDVHHLRCHQNIRKEITTAQVGRGREDLSREDLQRLDDLIGEDLRRHGYPAATDDACQLAARRKVA